MAIVHLNEIKKGKSMAWYNLIDNASEANAARKECNKLESAAEDLKLKIKTITESIQKIISSSEAFIFA